MKMRGRRRRRRDHDKDGICGEARGDVGGRVLSGECTTIA